jgi:AmmeMemoRadiSam system protein B/AmmeMemoRadiSam system protein A
MRYSKLRSRAGLIGFIALFCFISIKRFPCAGDVISQRPDRQTIVQQAKLGGSWYPAGAEQLRTKISSFFSFAKQHFNVAVTSKSVKALIVPHAGYRYSGMCAASAYRTLLDGNKKNQNIKRVFLMAPSHYENFYGIALPKYGAYRTSLGDCQIDQRVVDALKTRHPFKVIENAHEKEHSLEIQLPFLQETIENFMLVPLVVGNLSDKDYTLVSQVLHEFINDQTLVVVSSDLIHHGPRYSFDLYKSEITDRIKQLDSTVIEAIMNGSFNAFEKAVHRTAFSKKPELTICGRNPIKILLKLIERKTLDSVSARLCSYYTSAHMHQFDKDTKSTVSSLIGSVPDVDAQNCVSYGGLIFTNEPLASRSPEEQLTGYEKKALLTLAREVLKNAFARKQGKGIEEALLLPIASPGVERITGAFVTLSDKNDALRGCVGRIRSNDPLSLVVAAMAKAAAFSDSRFLPLTKEELPGVGISISVLTKPSKIDDYNKIILSKHGIILSKKKRGLLSRSVFLPHVATSFGWDLSTTLRQLSKKARLDSEEYKDAQFEVFESFSIKEKEKINFKRTPAKQSREFF